MKVKCAHVHGQSFPTKGRARKIPRIFSKESRLTEWKMGGEKKKRMKKTIGWSNVLVRDRHEHQF